MTKTRPKPNLVPFDLAHWYGHLQSIRDELADGYEEYVYGDFALDLFLTLGFDAYAKLATVLGELAGVHSVEGAYFDDEGRCFARREWGRYADEDALVSIYYTLGWEWSVLFTLWWRGPGTFDTLRDIDHDGDIPPRFGWCSLDGCAIHPRLGSAKVVIVERAHGIHCPDRAGRPAVEVHQDAEPVPTGTQVGLW